MAVSESQESVRATYLLLKHDRRTAGPANPPGTDGPFPETRELIAGWTVIDVEAVERDHLTRQAARLRTA